MATVNIPDEQAKRIQSAILARVGASPDSVIANGISYDSSGRVSIDFYVPRAELEAIINDAATEPAK